MATESPDSQVPGSSLMTAELFKAFIFEASHRLPNVPDGHKCGRLHGHSFRGAIVVRGDVGLPTGWIVGLPVVKRVFQPYFDQLEHNYLNDVAGLDNPTSENLARWIWDRLRSELPGLSKVIVHETCSAGAVYEGEQPR